MNDYISFTFGVICAGVGGEFFVRGVVGLAHWARISPGIIGATIAAFATSSPELSVSISAAVAGKPQIALGDALGSNVLNVALILSLALIISGIRCSRERLKRDLPVALLVPIITGVLFIDGVLSRLDGFIMLAIFFIWFFATVMEARKQRNDTDNVLGGHRRWLVVLSCLFGFVFLVSAGKLIVTGARGIAIAFGLDEFVVGATIVAVGTSVPELATTVIAKLRGHDEISLGTILGSNIFNGIFITAIAAVICPITVNLREVAVTLVFGLIAIVITIPTRQGWIERKRGVFLLVLFAVYLATILQY